MAGANSWRAQMTGADWMRDMEKRLLHEERRPIIHTASDLMGPGVAPYSVWINDWNADETAFNGFFHTDPTALNTPDPTRYWMGTSQGTSDGFGLQRVTEYLGGSTDSAWPRLTYIRKFFTPPGAQRRFSVWRLEDGNPPGLICEYGGSTVAEATWTTASNTTAWVPFSGWTITRQETRRVADNFIWTDVEGTRTGAPIVRNASGDMSNLQVATLSTSYVLTFSQSGMSSGQQGRVAHFNCYSDRRCMMTSFGGTSDYATGEDYSFGGPLAVTAIAQPVAPAVAPNGWRYCDGAVLVRTSFPDLFAAIGTRWNTGGETATQFRLPSLSGKVIRE